MPTCFVVQGFHKKTDFESGRVLDLDASYAVIKQAAEHAGYSCARADEIKHTKPIDVVMYEQLLGADLVIADLSTSNVNAFYELGVRFALRPYRTIVVAESQLNFPFDVNHIPIRTYKHLGEDVGMQEATRFIAELKDLIVAVDAQEPEPDSPVFRFLGLTPPKPQRAVLRTTPDDDGAADTSLSELKQAAVAAMKASDFEAAIRLWSELRQKGPKDDYVVQQQALATYKSELPTKREALLAAREILVYLWPQKSLDPETLGLWAAVNKRLYELDDDHHALDEAITATEIGWVLRNDYYNGINLAFLLDTRAAGSEGELSAEDHARAQAVRRQVVEICTQHLDGDEVKGDDRYWVLSTLEEATTGLGESMAAQRWHNAAADAAGADWMRHSTAEQLDKLRALLVAISTK